jgi:hypothetical protein
MKQLSILIIIFITVSCHYNKQQKNVLPRHVGDISFNAKYDDAGFQLCEEDSALQYYNFGKAIQYKGEKAQLERDIRSRFKASNTKESGYVTIRFVVNCQGKTGRFRIKELDKDYQNIEFQGDVSEQLLQICKELNGWKIGQYEGKQYDYYQYLTFKINKGTIERIMP